LEIINTVEIKNLTDGLQVGYLIDVQYFKIVDEYLDFRRYPECQLHDESIESSLKVFDELLHNVLGDNFIEELFESDSRGNKSVLSHRLKLKHTDPSEYHEYEQSTEYQQAEAKYQKMLVVAQQMVLRHRDLVQLLKRKQILNQLGSSKFI
jgi:hypothetical protein